MKIRNLVQSILFATLFGFLLLLSLHSSLRAKDDVAPVLASRTLNATIPTTSTLEAMRDNSIFAGDTNSGGASPILLAGMTDHDGVRRALLAFDVSSIPDNAVITSVALELTVVKVRSNSSFTFTLNRLTRQWGEAGSSNTGGQGAPAQSGDATWDYAIYSTTTWSNAGGDFLTTASATSDVGGNGIYTWTSGQMITDVTDWRQDPATNFGWILIGDESSNQSIKQIASRENSDVAMRPKLIVHYLVEQTTATVYLPLVQR